MQERQQPKDAGTSLGRAQHSLQVEGTGLDQVPVPARGLSAREWMRFLRVLPLVSLVRAALWATTSTRVHALLTRADPGSGGLESHEVDEWSRAVSRAARLVPHATCLTQALALQLLLRRQGEASRVEIGFLRGAEKNVKGHAWLVHRGRVVIGGKSSAKFTRTLELDG